MFKDSAFEVDEESETYRMLHPNAPKLTKREREEMLEEHFDLESDGDDDHEYDANGEAEAADAADASARRAARRRSAAVAKVKMYAAKDERHAAAFREGRRDVSSTLTLAERAAQQASSAGKKTRVSGNKELRFEAGERAGASRCAREGRGGTSAGTDRTGPPSRRGRRAGGARRSRNGAGRGECYLGEVAGGKADAEEAAGRDGGRLFLNFVSEMSVVSSPPAADARPARSQGDSRNPSHTREGGGGPHAAIPPASRTNLSSSAIPFLIECISSNSAAVSRAAAAAPSAEPGAGAGAGAGGGSGGARPPPSSHAPRRLREGLPRRYRRQEETRRARCHAPLPVPRTAPPTRAPPPPYAAASAPPPACAPAFARAPTAASAANA